MDFKNLTPEQMEKARACKNSAELIALAKDEGVELSDEMLEGLAGGFAWNGCSGYSCVEDYDYSL